MNFEERLRAFRADSAQAPEGEQERVLTRALEGFGTADRSRGRSGRVRLVLAGGLAAAMIPLGFVAGGALRGDDQPSAPTATDPATRAAPTIDVLESFGDDTAHEVATWIDQVVVARLIASTPEKDLGSFAKDGHEDGVVNRTVTFEVESVAWTRKGGVEVPKQIKTLTWGWIITDGRADPILPTDEATFELGKSYLLSVAKDGESWIVKAGASYELTAGAKVTPQKAQVSELSRQTSGLTPAEFGQLLTAAGSLPEAAPFLSLPLQARIKAYNDVRRSMESQ